jgi:endoglucanase
MLDTRSIKLITIKMIDRKHLDFNAFQFPVREQKIINNNTLTIGKIMFIKYVSLPSWVAVYFALLKRAAVFIGISLVLSTFSRVAVAGCDYLVSNEWNTGFTATIRITNSGTTSINAWNVSWQYAGADRMTNSWNATVTGANPYSATNLSWNGSIAAGQSVEFGFQGTKGSASAEKPTVTGAACGGGATSSLRSSIASSIPPSSVRSSVRSSVQSSVRSSVQSSIRSSVRSSIVSSIASSVAPSSRSSASSSSSVGGTTDWLHVNQNKVVDVNGRAVWLTGVNWFGFNTSERVFHGLWSAHFPSLMTAMANRGVNILRVPISVQLILEWKAGTFGTVNVNTFANPELLNLNSLQIFDRTLELAQANGMKVLLDMHSAEADNSGHVYPLWTHGVFTETDFYNAWTWIAERYKNNDTLVAYDLKNEPHGKAFSETSYAIWNDSSAPNNWKRVAQEAATRILAINPNVLILIEGIESYPKDGVNWTSRTPADYHNTWWGGNLRGVTQFPVTVAGHQDQIMYSPHDYGPSVYEQPWFYAGFSKATLIRDAWYDNWLYIHDKGIAPLLIGEWGGFMDAGRNEVWMRALRDMMIEKKMHHTFWCLNPNSGDTGGLIGNDWLTWDEAKYNLVKPSLWQLGNKFVGLDHTVPLGTSGLSLNQYYSNGGAEPIGN